jgi:inner membrane protein
MSLLQSRRTGSVRHAVAPALAILGILAVDLVSAAQRWPLLVTGLLDEPAHLLTAWLGLAALRPANARIWPWALLGAVLIDVDHIPLYLWGGPVGAEGGRPVSHSLVVVVALVVAARALPKVRVPLAGLAIGVLLHLSRDLATGPGIPLAWPFLVDNSHVPYPAYLVFLVLLAAVATIRRPRPTPFWPSSGSTVPSTNR